MLEGDSRKAGGKSKGNHGSRNGENSNGSNGGGDECSR